MIILLYGQDTYRSAQKLREMKDRFIRDVDPSRLNCDTIDSVKVSVSEIQKSVRAIPFLAKRRLIIFKNILSQGGKEFLDSFYSILEDYRLHYNADNSNILVFFESSEKLGRSKIVKLLKESQYSYLFDPLEGFAINKWIRTEVKDRGGFIDEDAIKELASLLGSDLWVLSSEIDKLIAYAYDRKIVRDDIKILVNGKFDDNIFHFIDALGSRDKKKSLELLNEQFSSGAHPLYVLTMLTRQFRILLSIQSLLSRGKSKKDISLFLGIHPFVVTKFLQNITKYSRDEIKFFYQELVKIDLQLKSGMIKDQGQILFELLVSTL